MKNKKEVINTDLIDEFIKNNKLSRYEFCSLCKVPYSVLEQIYNDDYNFDIIYFFKIAYKINIHPAQMFKMIDDK